MWLYKEEKKYFAEWGERLVYIVGGIGIALAILAVVVKIIGK
jgi:hypothetical protein